MNIESIGTWAGEVYKALENSDTRMLGLKLVKKATKLKKMKSQQPLAGSAAKGRSPLSKVTMT